MRSKRNPLNTQKVFRETHLDESVTLETFSQIVSLHEKCFDVRGVVIEDLGEIALRDIVVPLVGDQLTISRDNSTLDIDVNALGVYPDEEACVAMVNIHLKSRDRAALIGLQKIEKSLYLSSQTSFVVSGLATAISQRLPKGQNSAIRKVNKLEHKELKKQWVAVASGSLRGDSKSYSSGVSIST